MSETMAVWSERDECADTMPPLDAAGPRQRFGRMLLGRGGVAERAVDAARAVRGHEDTLYDWSRARRIDRAVVRSDRDRAAAPLTRLVTAIDRARDEARRIGVEDDLIACLQERNVELDRDRIAEGVGREDLLDVAAAYDAMANAVRELGEELSR